VKEVPIFLISKPIRQQRQCLVGWEGNLKPLGRLLAAETVHGKENTLEAFVEVCRKIAKFSL
jgi:hypothetical protein